jgi:hypothetical protein
MLVLTKQIRCAIDNWGSMEVQVNSEEKGQGDDCFLSRSQPGTRTYD